MKNTKRQIVTIACLCLIMLLMGVYFASVSYSAAVDATKFFGKMNSKWDVNIDELSYNETIGSVQAERHTISATTSTSEVTLTKPGEFYEYTIKIDNDGSLNAALRSINIEGLNEQQKNYLSLTVTYGEEKFTERAKDLNVLLSPKQSTNVIVRVEYKEVDPVVLPLVPQTFNLVTTFAYQQA